MKGLVSRRNGNGWHGAVKGNVKTNKYDSKESLAFHIVLICSVFSIAIVWWDGILPPEYMKFLTFAFVYIALVVLVIFTKTSHRAQKENASRIITPSQNIFFNYTVTIFFYTYICPIPLQPFPRLTHLPPNSNKNLPLPNRHLLRSSLPLPRLVHLHSLIQNLHLGIHQSRTTEQVFYLLACEAVRMRYCCFS